MTMLAHDAALLGISVDTGRLFDGDERYGLWIGTVVDRVADTKRRAA